MPRRLQLYRLAAVVAVVVLAAGLVAWQVLAGSPERATKPTASPQPTVAEAAAKPAVAASPTAAPSDAPSAAAAATPTATAATALKRRNGRIFEGYYVPYDSTSWQTFQAQADNLDYVSAQWVTVDECGNVGSRDDRTLLAFAKSKDVTVLPSLLTSSAWLDNLLLTDPATSQHFREQIVQYVMDEGYAGFDLDMEGIDPADRDAYSEFVAALAADLHAKGKLLTLAVPGKASDVRTGWAGPYDYAALGKSADLILLMTYDYSWANSEPGSVAPQDWVAKVAAYSSSQIPSEKILIGSAFYGYDWNTTRGGTARALNYSQAAAIAQQYGVPFKRDATSRSATFSYTAQPGDARPATPAAPALQHDISVRQLGPCVYDKTPTPTPSGPRPTPSPSPTATGPQQHEVWIEDAMSLAGRLEIVGNYKLAGVGAWRLGQEDPAVWPLVARFHRSQ